MDLRTGKIKWQGGSPYYSNKPDKLMAIYKEDCMKYLTFLDYGTVESEGRSFEAKAKELEKVNEKLNARIRNLELMLDSKEQESKERVDMMKDLYKRVEQLEKKQQ